MSQLKENNRWVLDSKDKNENKRRKDIQKRKDSKSNLQKVHTKEKDIEINLNSKELFPSFDNLNEKNTVVNNYLEKIKNQKEQDEQSIKLKPGWVAYKKDKKTNKVMVSRNGKNYFENIEDTYSLQEQEYIKRIEFNRNLDEFTKRINKIYLRDKIKSEEYYYETGLLDIFAQVEKEAIEYEEYLKKFDIEEEEYDEFNESDSDDMSILSDDDFKKR